MKWLICSIALLTLLLSRSATAQPPSQFCKINIPDKVVLEVDVTGRGMIWPNLITQVFFRLYEDGVLEYDGRTGHEIVKKRHKLKDQEVSELMHLAESSDFLNADERYSLLKDLRDAVLKTCVTYNRNGRYKRILILNYMPSHPSANDYYPPSLVKLLSRVTEVRPKTEYERKYGFGKIELPY